MNVHRAALLAVDPGVVVSDVHNSSGKRLGKISVLVAFQSSAPADQLAALGKQLAMHVAAANPLALDEGGIDPEVVERERAIAREKAAGSGKPADIVEKMVEGGVRKFMSESTLMGQMFVIDGKTKVADVIDRKSTRLNSQIG